MIDVPGNQGDTISTPLINRLLEERKGVIVLAGAQPQNVGATRQRRFPLARPGRDLPESAPVPAFPRWPRRVRP